MAELIQGQMTSENITDTVAPILNNITPSLGSTLDPPTGQTIQFDITSDSGGISSVVIVAQYTSGPGEAAFSGSTFKDVFAAGSTRTVITNGFQFKVQRGGTGWLEDFDLEVSAVGNDGGVLVPSPTLLNYLVPNGVGASAARTPVKVSTGGI